MQKQRRESRAPRFLMYYCGHIMLSIFYRLGGKKKMPEVKPWYKANFARNADIRRRKTPVSLAKVSIQDIDVDKDKDEKK